MDGFTGIPLPDDRQRSRCKTPAELYWLVWGVAGVALLLAANMVSLRPGRAMRAIHGSELGRAGLRGRPRGRQGPGVRRLGDARGALGRAVRLGVGFISPSVFTLAASVIFLAMAVIGGSGSLAGPCRGRCVLTLAAVPRRAHPRAVRARLLRLLQQYEADIYGLAIILVVLFAPAGIGSALRAPLEGG